MYLSYDDFKDGWRRRTPGGVYIQLIKNDHRMTTDKHKAIFAEEQKKFFASKRQKLKQK